MRWILVALVLLSSVRCSPLPEPRAGSAAATVFTRIGVVDVERGEILPEQTVLFVGNHIQEVGPSARVRLPPRARVIDARGRYVLPGPWDMHIHDFGGSGSTVLEPTNRDLALTVANGLTGIRNMHSMVPLQQIAAMRRSPGAGRVVGLRSVVASQMLDGPRARWLIAVPIADPSEATYFMYPSRCRSSS